MRQDSEPFPLPSFPPLSQTHRGAESDVIVVGAGPIGLETAVNLKLAGFSVRHFEAGVLGQTIRNWPRNAVFFSSPERCAIAGVPIQSLHQTMLTGEEYLAYLRQVVELRELEIQFHTPVHALRKTSAGFELLAGKRGFEEFFRSTYVVLATGNMAFPRRLGVPGEDLPHVSHRFVDVHRYFQQRLLVVGGRNSAVEAAIRCWRAGAKVDISYRRENFEKKKLNSRYHLEISILTEKKKIGFLPLSKIREICPDRVIFDSLEGREEKLYDFVLVQIGYDNNLRLLEDLGLRFVGKERVPDFDPNSMESSIPGLFLAGTLTDGGQGSHRTFVATSHHHAGNIVRHLTGNSAVYAGSVSQRSYPFGIADILPTEGSGEASSAEPLPDEDDAQGFETKNIV